MRRKGPLGPTLTDERIFHEIAQLVVDVAARAQSCAAQRRVSQGELEEIQRLIQLALRALEERKNGRP